MLAAAEILLRSSLLRELSYDVGRRFIPWQGDGSCREVVRARQVEEGRQQRFGSYFAWVGQLLDGELADRRKRVGIRGGVGLNGRYATVGCA